MDAIRVPKVEHVEITKAGVTSLGTVHLTAHHLIFHHDNDDEQKQKQEEMWVPYPLISLVNRLPQTLHGQTPLSFQTRTFETFILVFKKNTEAQDVFESVKELTVAISVTQLYAFYYRPTPSLPTNNGWSLYSPREEFGRMGLGTRTKAWRFTDINKDYTFCPTYPAKLVVPTRISDTTLQYASKYRSKCRIPALSYLHWANFGSITRSSQPMVGLTQSRSIQDEKLIESIFQSHISPKSRASSGPVYGATTTNLIIDARPTANAVANTAKGAGTENMDNYKEAKKAYLGIDNVHVVRDSLMKMVEVFREADTMLASINSDLSSQVAGISVLDRQALRRSGWLRHLQAIMEGSVLIAKNVHINSSHVLIHCSDGWDRTSQLSSIAQLCLDPFYRTIRGFEILIEKDWLSFGHKFLDRCGHLSSEKFFISPSDISGSGDAAQAFLASVQNRFASQNHIKETSPVFHQFLECVRQIQRQFPKRLEFNERFLRQIYYHLYSCQFGTFLFNTEKERKVGLGDGFTGPPPCERTASVWDFLNSTGEMEKNLNEDYDPSLDDPTSRLPNADMGVLFPNSKDIRFWNELYGRTDEEMNGRIVVSPPPPPPVTSTVSGTATTPQIVEFVGPIERSEDDPVLASLTKPNMNTSTSLPPSPSVPIPPNVTPSRSLNVSMHTLRSHSPDTGRPKDSFNSLPELTQVVSSGGAALASIVPDWFSSSSPSSTSTPSKTATPVPLLSSPINSTSTGMNTNTQATRERTSTTPVDIFGGAGTGVKSVWGKLSFNATAAFSAVQEVYAGVAKDFGRQGVNETDSSIGGSGGGSGNGRTAELNNRDTLSGWGETRSKGLESKFGGMSVSVGNPNPWAIAEGNTTTNNTATIGATSTSLSSTASWDDNPWNMGTPRPSSSSIGGLQPLPISTRTPVSVYDDDDPESSLPLDPNVATSLRRKPNQQENVMTRQIKGKDKNLPKVSVSDGSGGGGGSGSGSGGGTDPLGVGPL